MIDYYDIYYENKKIKHHIDYVKLYEFFCDTYCEKEDIMHVGVYTALEIERKLLTLGYVVNGVVKM